MNKLLFNLADFLGRPPGFYFVLALMVISTALIPLGLTDVVTHLLSVAAIVITGVVLIQGDTGTPPRSTQSWTRLLLRLTELATISLASNMRTQR